MKSIMNKISDRARDQLDELSVLFESQRLALETAIGMAHKEHVGPSHITRQLHIMNHNDAGEWILVSFSLRPSRQYSGAFMVTQEDLSFTPEACAGISIMRDGIETMSEALCVARTLRQAELTRLTDSGYEVSKAQNW